MAKKREKADEPEQHPGAGETDPRQKSGLRENFESIAFAVLFALFVRTFIAQPYKIPSGSMEDNLLIGDHLVVNKVDFGAGAQGRTLGFLPVRGVERGDVVIFRPPPVRGVTDESTDFIKRVIGLPGEELTLTYDAERDGVRVTVDGTPLAENWRADHFAAPREESGAEWTVTFDPSHDPPEIAYPVRHFKLGSDEYFVMGDNRNDSADSRFWGSSYAVKAERIRGHALFVYWSYDVGEDDPEPRGFLKRLVNYVKIGVRFARHSRWNRTFLPIR